MMRIACMAVLWIACISSLVHASDRDSIVLGVNPQLADGATALTIGNYDEGIRLTQLGLNSPPKPRHRSAALSNLCAGFGATSQFERALAHCTAALEIDKRNWQAYNNRAVAYLGLGRLEAAEADITRAVVLNPRSEKLQRARRAVVRWLEDER
jgi:Flp pilus assembly protein TadD